MDQAVGLQKVHSLEDLSDDPWARRHEVQAVGWVGKGGGGRVVIWEQRSPKRHTVFGCKAGCSRTF